MNIGCKLQKLRKAKGLSQEELANILEVSRQSVSKWESDISYPETEKLIKLCDFYKVTIDSLLRNDCVEDPTLQKKEEIVYRRYHYEYKSKRRLFGIPLVHINIGSGLYVSKGIVSIGNISLGVVSFGLLSLGLLSIGVLAIGLISLGAIALGLIFAAGSIAFGAIAVGAIAVGFFSIGALSIGYFSVGALSIGKYIAIGDTADALIAIGKTKASGTYTFTDSSNKQEIIELIDTQIPAFWNIFKEWIKNHL